MDTKVYNNIKTWFENFVENLSNANNQTQPLIHFKLNHSYRTVELIKLLATTIETNNCNSLLSQTIALLHDIGSFKIISEENEFSKSEKISLAELSVSILNEKNVLADLQDNEKEIVLDCIKYNELDTIPKSIHQNALPFLLQLRDASRIDNLTSMANHFSGYLSTTSKERMVNFLKTPEISKKVCRNIVEEKVVCYSDIVTINDFKLHQMSWVFDFNFKKSFQLCSERTLLKKIYETLPKTDSVIDLYRQMKIHLENQL